VGVLVFAALGVGRAPAEVGQELLGGREPPDGAVQLSWVKLIWASQAYDQPATIGWPADWREGEK
jgi:hypothetical protein